MRRGLFKECEWRSMRTAEDYEQILAFIYELQNDEDGSSFSLRTLQLLDKYFGYSSAIFSIRYSFKQEFPIDRPYAQEPFMDLVSIGIPRDALRRYFAGPHKGSIFWQENMTPELFARPVLLAKDIMPLEEYKKTQAYADFTRGKLRSQMLMQLNHGRMQLGSIMLFRQEGEPEFDEEDRQLAEILCPYITQAYKMRVDDMQNKVEIEFSHQYHKSLSYGSIVLDNTFTVIRYNDKAQEYCYDILAHYYGTSELKERPHVVLRGGGTVADIQGYVSQNRERLWGVLDKPASIQSIGLEQRYASTIISLSTKDITGKMNIYYIISMTAQPAEVVDTNLCLQYGLTNREIQVASYIVQGYTNKQIGEQMFISTHTAKTHITKIFAKTGTSKRAELAHKLGHLAQNG